MAHVETTLAVMNSIIFVGDRGAEPPLHLDGIIGIQKSCIAIGTRIEIDGETHIQLFDGGLPEDVVSGLMLIASEILEIPSGEIAVETADAETLLSCRVRDLRVRCNIFVNNDKWPDEIVIGVEPAE